VQLAVRTAGVRSEGQVGSWAARRPAADRCAREGPAPAGPSSYLPRLIDAAVRAGDRRGHRCAEQVAALADVGGPIDRPAGLAYARDVGIACLWGGLANGLARRGPTPASVSPRVPRLAKGVQEARSHDSLGPTTSSTPKGFAVQPLFPRCPAAGPARFARRRLLTRARGGFCDTSRR